MKICSRCVVQTDNLNFVRFCRAPLTNLARENVNNLEWRKRACATSCRPVNPTVNLVISRVRRAHKYSFLLKQPKRSAIHRRRIGVNSSVKSVRWKIKLPLKCRVFNLC